MTTWNYRVMKFVENDGDSYHQVHEVADDNEGHPNAYTKKPVSVFSTEGIDGLGWDLGGWKCLSGLGIPGGRSYCSKSGKQQNDDSKT